MPVNENDLIRATDSLYQVDEVTFNKLFSAQRIQNFGGRMGYKNYYQSSKPLYPAIHTLEVVLRNQIDRTLSKYNPQDPYWIMDLFFYNARTLRDKNQQIAISKAQKNIESAIENLSCFQNSTISAFWNNYQDKKEIHNILISRLNLGFWIIILQNNKLFNNIYSRQLDFAEEIFPKLKGKIDNNQKIFYAFLSKKNNFGNRLQGMSPSEKTILLVSFLSSIRNRLNHCERVFYNNGDSSITTRQYGVTIYLECRKNKVFEFLKTMLEEFL